MPEIFSVEESVAIAQDWMAEVGLDQFPETLITLGSGWNEVLNKAKIIAELDYEKVFGLKTKAVGHVGRLVIADLDGERVAFMQGRLHMYDGLTAEQVTRPLQVWKQLGLERVVLTAAVGALNGEKGPLAVGEFVILSDLITQFMQSPLVGDAQFQNMIPPFSPELRQIILDTAKELDLPHSDEGVYVGVVGPHYETAADKKLLKALGADVVGMSTVPETIMANHLGLEVMAIAFVTNLAFGKHDGQEVVAEANKSGDQMAALLLGVIQKLSNAEKSKTEVS